MKKFDASTPRWRYWVKRARSSMRCPRCGGELQSETHTYMVLVKQAGEIESILCGVDGGYFCNSCPSVVLDREKFENLIRAVAEGNDYSYVVPAIVDMDAIPEEKRHVELGSDDNPIPLVEFKEPKMKSISSTRTSKKKKTKRRKKK